MVVATQHIAHLLKSKRPHLQLLLLLPQRQEETRPLAPLVPHQARAVINDKISLRTSRN